MKALFATIFTLLMLTSCQSDPVRPVAELPFGTHPSELRGNWSGTIFNTPESKNSMLELIDLTAECADYQEENIPESQCYFYTFSGSVSLNGSSAVDLTGEGYAGDYIYTLTSPRDPLMPNVQASFELDENVWILSAIYRPGDTQNLEAEPTFEGVIFQETSGRFGNEFRLEPINP